MPTAIRSSVIRAIFDEEARRRASGYAESFARALNVEDRGRDNRKGKSKNHSKSRGKSIAPNPNGDGEGKCFYCGLKGHYARDCRKSKVEDNLKGRANVAHNQKDSDALLLSIKDKVDAGVIDSGASFDAISRKEMLNYYVKKDLRTVYLGDDGPCKISVKGDDVLMLENHTFLLQAGISDF